MPSAIKLILSLVLLLTLAACGGGGGDEVGLALFDPFLGRGAVGAGGVEVSGPKAAGSLDWRR